MNFKKPSVPSSGIIAFFSSTVGAVVMWAGVGLVASASSMNTG